MTRLQERAMKLYIDGAWVDAVVREEMAIINPATETEFARIALGSRLDVDRAVAAARHAFPAFAATTKSERLSFLRRMSIAYSARLEEFAQTVSREMGAPITLAREAQAVAGMAHIEHTIEALEKFDAEELWNSTLISREPIGVVGMITPWNWPLNQILAKVAPAIAAGCTMVLKPSEVAPLNAVLLAEAIEEAGLPQGVFNLVQGTGQEVGEALAAHPDVDMVSFTGSTRAGVAVAVAAAPTVKRVHQELGGKSANIILDDAELEIAVRNGVDGCFLNSGQSCDAPTRMLVPAKLFELAVEIAADAARSTVCGDPEMPGPHLGPLANMRQFERVQSFIDHGQADGARLVAGGTGRPAGLDRGYYTRPTVFACQDHRERVAREEIFGPVLAIIPYDGDDEAVRLANESPFGLAAYVQSSDMDRARAMARQLRTGNVHLNYPDWSSALPFGGYKQSGNGRENGLFGLLEFHEIKATLGFANSGTLRSAA